jgi:hypothetical protein
MHHFAPVCVISGLREDAVQEFFDLPRGKRFEMPPAVLNGRIWPPANPSLTAPRISFFTPTVAFSMMCGCTVVES